MRSLGMKKYRRSIWKKRISSVQRTAYTKAQVILPGLFHFNIALLYSGNDRDSTLSSSILLLICR